MPKLNDELFHYKECGLPNVFLTSGYNYHDSEYGEGVSFNNFDDLHKAIIFELTGKPSALTGEEVRFLRVELDLSQKELGNKLGVKDQTISLWERSEGSIGFSESLVLRLLALEECAEHALPVSVLIDRIASVDFDADDWMIVLAWTSSEEKHWVPGNENVA